MLPWVPRFFLRDFRRRSCLYRDPREAKRAITARFGRGKPLVLRKPTCRRWSFSSARKPGVRFFVDAILDNTRRGGAGRAVVDSRRWSFSSARKPGVRFFVLHIPLGNLILLKLAYLSSKADSSSTERLYCLNNVSPWMNTMTSINQSILI